MNGGFVYALVLGIFLGLVASLVLGWGTLAAGIFVLLAIGSFFLAKRFPHALLFAALCGATVLGIVRADYFRFTQSQETVTQFVGNTAVLQGKVVDDPDVRATSVRVTLQVTSVNKTAATGVILALLPSAVEVSYGDTIVVQGPLVLPQTFLTNSGRTFDYPHYLEAHGIIALVQPATLVHDTPGGRSLLGVLFAVKHAFENSIERTIAEPHAALLEGLLLGERRGLSQSLNNDFIRSGLIHVVVLSGYNISVVAEGIFRVLSFLPRAFSFPLGGVSIILFALMTGSGAATVRACAMAILALMARYFHRQVLAVRTLVLTAAGMAMWNPLSFLYDPSFILSVLATFGLIAFGPAIERRLPAVMARVPDIRSIVASTLSVQIYVLPALLYFSGTLSFVSIPANALALPVVPLAMLLGFVAGILGFISPLLALAPAVFAQILLWWMIFVAHTAANLPYAATVTPAFPAWLMVLIYIPLTAVAIYFYRRSAALSQSS